MSPWRNADALVLGISIEKCSGSSPEGDTKLN